MSRVLVVGGSEEYSGAVYLAGIAALRSGAESVIVMAPEKVAWALNALSPDRGKIGKKKNRRVQTRLLPLRSEYSGRKKGS